ncbi:hypothetical protein BDR05DRAFT_961708 [Suillus weaverae]|nr:hypothetical protein BDR05DRAFT_961708 [Suillus weaverae]
MTINLRFWFTCRDIKIGQGPAHTFTIEPPAHSVKIVGTSGRSTLDPPFTEIEHEAVDSESPSTFGLLGLNPEHGWSKPRASKSSIKNWQQFICSYMPTLSALVRSRQMMKKRVPPSFVAIGQGQPSTGKSKELLAVDSEIEIELVQKLVPATANRPSISGDAATLQALQENTTCSTSNEEGVYELHWYFRSATLLRWLRRSHWISLLVMCCCLRQRYCLLLISNMNGATQV